VPKIILGQPQALSFLRESTKSDYYITLCGIKPDIKRIIFSNSVESHNKTPVSMRQVKDHICPGLARRVPTICLLLSAPFHERVSYFAVYMLLLQYATITKQNIRVDILESSGMAKSSSMIALRHQ
jgi:hypothetical protein